MTFHLRRTDGNAQRFALAICCVLGAGALFGGCTSEGTAGAASGNVSVDSADSGSAAPLGLTGERVAANELAADTDEMVTEAVTTATVTPIPTVTVTQVESAVSEPVVVTTQAPQQTVVVQQPRETVVVQAPETVYVQPRSTVTEIVVPSYNYQHCWKSCNARSGPGTNYSVINQLSPSDAVTIYSYRYGWSDELQTDVEWSETNYGWIRSDLISW